jgi:transcriptional regulator with XRE-family HTH domain
MISSLDQTQELAAFLRSRRERLDPRDFGLPMRRPRRTPGLRREEVAELAGISIDYVVRLEQARGLHPSADVLESLSRALRLEPDERAYLFNLAQQRPTFAEMPATAAAAPLADLVADLSPLPAMLMNHRYDIVAWNDEMVRLLLDFGALPPRERNAMWICLMHPDMRNFYVDRDRVVREGVSYVRAAWAAHPDDQALADLIAELTTDPHIADLWSAQAVKKDGRGQKLMRHPAVGLLSMNFETLIPIQDPSHRLLICRPADPQSRSALARLGTVPGSVTSPVPTSTPS